MSSLTDHVRSHYEEQRLTDRRLAEISAIARSGSSPVSRRPWIRYGSAAALLVTAVVVSVLLFSGPDVSAAVAREIAMNHGKALAVEFQASCCEDLCECMDKLDCSPVTPRRVRERGLRVVGARYCSIQGELAAQIRLEDRDGRRWTLYQCPCTPALEDIRESSTTIDGVRVEVWQEEGLFMGLAGPSRPTP